MKKLLCLFLCTFFVTFNTGCKKSEVRLNKYEISITLNEDMTLDGELTLNYFNNTKSEVDVLEFMLYPNAFSKGSKIKPIYSKYATKAFESGISYGGIEVISVKDEDSVLNFEVVNEDSHFLKVDLEKALKKGETIEINVDFFLTLPNVKHRFGYAKNTINLTGFYPILCPLENGEFYKSVYHPSGDPFYSEVANYKVDFKVPSNYVIASSMSPTGVLVEGQFTSYYYERNSVREIAFILSKNFNVVKSTINDVDVFYYYFEDENAENSLETAIKAISFFSSKIAKYPYDEYVFCEADFIYGGMEYPCLTMIDSSLYGFERDYTIVHETAHQWWYGLVGVNQNENAFIDEGLTEYSTTLFFDNFKEYGKCKIELLTAVYNAYFELRKNLSKQQSVTPKMNKNLGEFSSDIDYVSIAYYRSQLMFNELSGFMGEKRFNAFLKALCKEYAYKNLTLNNFLLCAEKYKRGAKTFLLNYIDGKSVVKEPKNY